MADEIKIRALIESVLDDRGFKGTDDALKKLRKGMQDTADGGLELKHSIAELKNEFLGFLAVAGLTEFYRESITAAAKLDRQWSALTQTVRGLGMNVEDIIPTFERFAAALELQGIDDNDTIAVLQKFIGLMGDANAAMATTKLAADISAAGYGSITDAASILTAVIQGRLMGATNAFGILLRDANGHAKSHVEVMQEIIDRYGDFLEKQNDTQKALDKTAVSIDAIKEKLGKQLEPAVRAVLSAFDFGIKVVQEFGATLGGIVNWAIAAVTSLGGQLRGLWDVMSGESERGWARIAQAQENYARDIQILEETLREQRAEIWNETADAQMQTEEEKQKGLQKLLDAAANSDKEARDKEVAAAREQAAKELAAKERLWEEIHDGQAAAGLRLAALNEKRIKEEEDDEARHLAYMTREWQRFLHIREQNWRSEQRLLEQEAARTTGTIGQQFRRRLAAFDSMVKHEIDAAKKEGRDITAIENYYANERAEIVASEARIKTETAAAAAGEIIGASQQAFGDNKALAIAAAIVNLYESITAIWAKWSAYPPVAAALIALTTASVTAEIGKIRSAGLGSGGAGFDDPRNDRAAYVGGYKWADDMIEHISRGWADRLSQLGGSSTVSHSNTVYAPNVSIHGFVGSGKTELLKQLNRGLKQIDRTIYKGGKIG